MLWGGTESRAVSIRGESNIGNGVLPFPLVSSDKSKRPARYVLEKMPGCGCFAEQFRQIRYRTNNWNRTILTMGAYNTVDSDCEAICPFDNGCNQCGDTTGSHFDCPKRPRVNGRHRLLSPITGGVKPKIKLRSLRRQSEQFKSRLSTVRYVEWILEQLRVWSPLHSAKLRPQLARSWSSCGIWKRKLLEESGL